MFYKYNNSDKNLVKIPHFFSYELKIAASIHSTTGSTFNM